ncbi:hypothetical protein SYNPS1DRAFT_29327 [Syncephalis pseudoplumigaleata]|uniref:Uncharacterized protein n=1 Tax=Syncephalis pseudoplumigaleata TaxID=1712513 RepID=A0A4P9Z0P8_9FUNG|nr:hypothetical protein SYNPS1DRAFT_29327 [Syncephalis pseudoplumigaleata]|eukprot:RKP24930.1 hypothetical protein SYNPS1DRAFT_29327 [Syncephalis pseudoplumigaleata]
MAAGQDSLSTYCVQADPSDIDAAMEGWIVYGFTTANTAFYPGDYCLSIRWRVDGDRKACFYSAMLFRMDIEMIPEDDMDWHYLLDALHEHEHWRDTGIGMVCHYQFADDDARRLVLHANMFVEPMVVTRIELAEWTDADAKMVDVDKVQPMYPLSAREQLLLLNSQAAGDDDGAHGLTPASVNMTVQLTLENMHPTFSLQHGQLLVVDGQQVQRPPAVVPSGQSINGRFSISWAMPEYVGASIAPLACLLVYEVTLPDGKELADRPHLVVGWRVDGGSLTDQAASDHSTSRQFFARIIGDTLTQDIVEQWSHHLTTPSDPISVAQKDQSFIDLAGSGLMPANAQSKERRLLADGRILLTHASLTSVAVASSNDDDDDDPTAIPSVHLALKVQLSREASRASITGEWSLNASTAAALADQ